MKTYVQPPSQGYSQKARKERAWEQGYLEVLENDDVTIIINPNNQRPGGKSLVVKQAGPAFSNFSGIEWMENFDAFTD